MKIRRLFKSDVPAAKQLWMDAFGDTEAFVRFYFDNKFTLKGSLGAFDGQTMAGDLTLQDMDVRMRGARLKTGFLAGCATREEYRNRGVMRDLLKTQLARMNKAGYSLCHLHPFLHDFYRKFGWETVSFMREVTASPPPMRPPDENLFSTDDLLRLYRIFTARADGCFERTPRDMDIRLYEHINDGGKVIAHGGGYALYFVTEHEAEVTELVWTEAPPGEVIAPLGAYRRPVRFFVPDYAEEAAGGRTCEYTMMRVVNAKRLLESLRLPDSSFALRVRDDFCGWNNTSFAVDCSGGCTRVREIAGAQTDAEADIREMARLVAGKAQEGSGALAEMFPCQKTCFFNTY